MKNSKPDWFSKTIFINLGSIDHKERTLSSINDDENGFFIEIDHTMFKEKSEKFTSSFLF